MELRMVYMKRKLAKFLIKADDSRRKWLYENM